MKLIIVESPTKAKTISNFLKAEPRSERSSTTGDDFVVESCNGHVRDLPKSRLGIDVENNFQPEYIIPVKKKKAVNNLKKVAAGASQIYLATDEDREGESIAWHLDQILTDSKPSTTRIAFHEITEEAIKEALKNPREIDLNLVNAQQARRVLDRLVGYTLSPVLWEKIAKKLSAGRVQSPALRLIVEREREIGKFKPEKYWTIEVLLEKKDRASNFKAELTKIKEQPLPKPGLKNKKEVEEIVKNLKKEKFFVSSLIKKDVSKTSSPPFTTSTLQQEANNKLSFSARQTMYLAQKLYETGLITYMRTDSLNLSEKFLAEASNFIEKEFGKNYHEATRYKTKTIRAQEAHEAIRPTSVFKKPEELKDKMEKGQFKLYKLIFQRAIGSQMTNAIFERTDCEISAGDYLFKAFGLSLKFSGWLILYPEKQKEESLPSLEEKEELNLSKTETIEHLTQGPSRFSEASLIKTLESLGIGRPSTYVPIIETLKERNYVTREARYLKPTEIGFLVSDLLSRHFPEIVDYQFTAQMEENLDKIAIGETDWVSLVKNFYLPFKEKVDKKGKEIEKNFAPQETKKVCPKCGKPLIIKMSRFGKFLACSGFPLCRFTQSLEENNNSLKIKCPKCQKGEIVKKRTKKGRFFYACNTWPLCDFALWDEPINEFCPKCSSILVKTKKGVKCSSKECRYFQSPDEKLE